MQVGSNKRVFRLAREEARVGFSSAPETGQVADVEALVQAWLGAWNVAAGGHVVRSSLLAPQPGAGSRDHRRRRPPDPGVRARPAPALLERRAAGCGAAGGGDAGDRPDERERGCALDPTGWLGVSLLAGAYRDGRARSRRNTVAAELRLPRVLGGAALAGGVEADEGWMRSQLIYGQLVTRFGERVRLLARVSMSANEYATPVLTPNIYELGGYLHLDGALASWLRLRAWSSCASRSSSRVSCRARRPSARRRSLADRCLLTAPRFRARKEPWADPFCCFS